MGNGSPLLVPLQVRLKVVFVFRWLRLFVEVCISYVFKETPNEAARMAMSV